jgi:hypothetical protein
MNNKHNYENRMLRIARACPVIERAEEKGSDSLIIYLRNEAFDIDTIEDISNICLVDGNYLTITLVSTLGRYLLIGDVWDIIGSGKFADGVEKWK